MDSNINTGQLGQIVAWRVPRMVSVYTLRSALGQAGLDPDMAGDLHPRHIFSRALRDMKKGRVICRLRELDKSRVAFQLTHQEVGESEVQYDREAVAQMDLRTGKVTADDPIIEEQARALVAEHTAKRLTSDMSRLVQRLYDAHHADLVPVREQGGVYFVPDRHNALVDQTRTFLGAIGGRLNSFAVRLGCLDTEQSVAESLSEYINGLITEFRASCDGVTHETRMDVVARRHERVAELRGRLDSYHGLLGGFADIIQEEINRAERDLLARIAGQSVTEEAVA